MGKLNFGNPNLSYNLYIGTDFNTSDFVETKALWRRVWVDELRKIDPESSVDDSDFDRQHFIGAIFSGPVPVAVHLYSVWDAKKRETFDNKYFQQYPPKFCDDMYRSDLSTLISFEYLTVDMDYRKSKIGFSLAEVIIQCGTYLTKEEGFDAAIAPARSDYRVNDYCYRLGFDKYGESYKCHNVDVDTIVGYKYKLKENNDFLVTKISRDIWQNRVEKKSLQEAAA